MSAENCERPNCLIAENDKIPILREKISFPLCLAPMVGLSHVALRELLRSYLPEGERTIWPTEMLNSRRIPSENLAKTAETLRGSSETDLVPQILGNEFHSIKMSIEKLKIWGATGVDINMGCPVTKALRHNYGVALMGDAKYAAEVVKMAVDCGSDLPVSVKLRAADENDLSKLVDFCNGLVDSGAQWLCLHPRTADQKRRGTADWEQIAFLKDTLKIPIIGNGDIQCVEDVENMLSLTHCDMVMSGRALAARPWMLWQFGENLGLKAPLSREGERAPRTELEEGSEYGKCLLRLIDLADQYFGVFGEGLVLRKIRFYIRMTSVWLTYGHQLQSIGAKSQSVVELKKSIEEFFSFEQPMVKKTDLRI